MNICISAEITRKVLVRTKKVFYSKIDLSFAALANDISLPFPFALGLSFYFGRTISIDKDFLNVDKKKDKVRLG